MHKKVANDLFKILIFIAIINLPFLGMIQLIGIDTFLDSFEFPGSYNYFKNNKYNIENVKGDFLVIQRVSHPNFSIKNGDEILYMKDEGDLICTEICDDKNCGEIKKYYIINFNDKNNSEFFFEYQIIGKVVSNIDYNIWNALSLKIWELSINHLNIAALFTSD